MRGRLLEALAYFQSRDGQHDEALALWDEASQLAPQLEDAGFNAGQAAYNLRRYDDALRLWQRALSAKGADLRLQQKIVQALNALARHQEAEEALQALHPLWEQSPDRTAELVVDQLHIGGALVLALERMEPAGAFFQLWTFAVQGAQVTVQLESTAYGRERGTPYLMATTVRGRHKVVGPAFQSRPRYAEIRPLAADLLREILTPKGQA